MSPTMTTKLVFLFILFTITTSFATQNATVNEENYKQELTRGNIPAVDEKNYEQGLTSGNIPDGERGLLERELRSKQPKKPGGGRGPKGTKPPKGPKPPKEPKPPKQPKPPKGPKSPKVEPPQQQQGGSMPAVPVGRAADVTVAQDGSGNYRSIKEAIDAATRRGGDGRFVIYVKAGTYKEGRLTIAENLRNIMLTGDGIGKTIITGDNNAPANGGQTWSAATIVIAGDGFVARDITFQNTFTTAPAPAVTIDSPFAAFYKCSFDGYKYTLFARHGTHFFRECDVYGTVDFICGDAIAVFQNCNIYARKRMDSGKKITITAQKRKAPNSPTGFVFHNCRIMADANLAGLVGNYKIYFGRPWDEYSRTVFIQNDIDVAVDPEGWTSWDDSTGAVVSNGFIACDITFRNTAGPQNGMAVALIPHFDRSVFYPYSFEGFQDTPCVHSQTTILRKMSFIWHRRLHFWKRCRIIFQNCFIHGRRPLHGNQIVITAQS